MTRIWLRWARIAHGDLHFNVMGMFTMMITAEYLQPPKRSGAFISGEYIDFPQFARVYCTNQMLTSIPDHWHSSPGLEMSFLRELVLSNPEPPL
jgi:hypothetical protein